MDDLLIRDLEINWHPLLSYQRQRAGEVLAVVGASGDHLILADGRRVIDGISSWWCKLLGHQHPRLQQALIKQAGIIEHTIFANTTSAPLVKLAELLRARIPGTERILYAGDGSSAVDMALKLSLFVHASQGSIDRRLILHLQNAYHGDSVGAMSVSDVGLYTQGYGDVCFDSPCLSGLPYLPNRADQQWRCAEQAFERCLPQLEPIADRLAAIIFEPLLQGASGMQVYSADFLRRLCQWARLHNVHTIADEIMTGMGRVGAWTASSIAGVEPDIVLLSKSLTAGWLPFSAVLCREEIARAGLVEAKSPFAHSHTYMGHPLGAAVAIETIAVIEAEGVMARVNDLENELQHRFARIARETGALNNVRGLGAVVAADISTDIALENIPQLSAWMLERGLLLRPLSRTLYWMPPATVSTQTLEQMEEITSEALSEFMRRSQL